VHLVASAAVGLVVLAVTRARLGLPKSPVTSARPTPDHVGVPAGSGPPASSLRQAATNPPLEFRSDP
jgi:hypothetical protein